VCEFSDFIVWSFAVTVWETTNKGAMPYGSSAQSMGIIKQVIAGTLRLEYPEWLPSDLKDHLGSCMLKDPKARPSFAETVKLLDEEEAGGEVVYASLAEIRAEL
jgi:serine/threonine protein kinase